MLRQIAVGFVVVAVLVTGCSSSGGSHAAHLPTCDSACLHSEFDDTGSGSTPPATGLTGFGATRAEWDANHEADGDPKLDKGCCYLPLVDTVDQTRADTWQIPAPGGRMTFYTRRFPESTTETTALGLLAMADLPSDAKQIGDVTDGACRNFLFSSALLAQVDGEEGPNITVTLFSPQMTDPYDASNVEQAQLSSGDTLHGIC